MDRQISTKTDRLAEGGTDRLALRLTEGWTDRLALRLIGWQKDGQTDCHSD